MIRKKRMSKGIAKILSGLLVFGMVAGLVPAVPGGTVHAKAEGESEQNVTAAGNPEHKHCVCGTGELTAGNCSHEEKEWKGISDLSEITEEGYYYLKDNVTIQSAWNCPYDVTLCLNGHSITREGNDEQDIYNNGGNAVIKITKNISFALTDCQETVGTITHKAGVSGEGVYNAGNFNMYNGKISGNNGGVTNQRTLKCMGEQSVRILLNTAEEYIIKIQVHSTCTVVQSLIIQQALATMMVAEVCTMKVCSACPVDIFSKTSPLIMVEE